MIGTSVEYIASNTIGSDVITVYADDAYAPDNNTYIADDQRKSDAKTVTIVGLEVYEVGFAGGDHSLYETPASEWDDGTAAISDPIWEKDETTANNTARNHVCYTRSSTGVSTVRVRVPTALTESASFHLRATGQGATWSTTASSIGAGQTESSQGTCTSDTPFAGTVKKKTSLLMNWDFIYATGANVIRNLSSTSHNTYLTWGAPSGSSLTIKRIDHVTTVANGAATERQVADLIHQGLAGDPPEDGHDDPQSDDWDLMYGIKEGECDEQARFMVKQLKMVGSTGTAYITYPSTDANVTSQEGPISSGGQNWYLLFDFDNNGVPDNNFEGSVEAVGHNYAVWPSLDADSKLNLLREIGPGSPPPGFGAKQVWGRFDNTSGTYIRLPGSNDVPYP